ncbi:MAG TPA: hypothetical protein VF065_15060 [Ilumatobacter sp.]
MSRPCADRPAMTLRQSAGNSGDEMSEGGRTSNVDGARPARLQANWPTARGAVVVEVDVELLVLVVVDVLLVVVLVLLVVVVLVLVDVVLVLVVVGEVVVVEVVLVDVDDEVAAPAGASVAGAAEPVSPLHPAATTRSVMTGSTTRIVR